MFQHDLLALRRAEDVLARLMPQEDSVAAATVRLAAAMRRLCHDEEIRKRLGDGGREAARAYDAARLARRLLRVYQQLVSAPK